MARLRPRLVTTAALPLALALGSCSRDAAGGGDDRAFREALYRLQHPMPDIQGLSEAQRLALAPSEAAFRDAVLRLDASAAQVGRIRSLMRHPVMLQGLSRRSIPALAPLESGSLTWPSARRRDIEAHGLPPVACRRSLGEGDEDWRRPFAPFVYWRGPIGCDEEPVAHYTTLYRRDIDHLEWRRADVDRLIPPHQDATSMRELLECLSSSTCVDMRFEGQGPPRALAGEDDVASVTVTFSVEGSRLALDFFFYWLCSRPLMATFDEVALSEDRRSGRVLARCSMRVFVRGAG